MRQRLNIGKSQSRDTQEISSIVFLKTGLVRA
jgi:hypothetical protein